MRAIYDTSSGVQGHWPSRSDLRADGCTLAAVRTQALLFAGVVPALAACSVLPDAQYGEAKDICEMDVFAPGTEMEWAGRGNPAALGLVGPGTPDMPEGQAEIYVGAGAAGDGRVFCAVWPTSGGTAANSGPVPDGWQPPLVGGVEAPGGAPPPPECEAESYVFAGRGTFADLGLQPHVPAPLPDPDRPAMIWITGGTARMMCFEFEDGSGGTEWPVDSGWQPPVPSE
jgi:hypothetical protein